MQKVGKIQNFYILMLSFISLVVISYISAIIITIVVYVITTGILHIPFDPSYIHKYFNIYMIVSGAFFSHILPDRIRQYHIETIMKKNNFTKISNLNLTNYDTVFYIKDQMIYYSVESNFNVYSFPVQTSLENLLKGSNNIES